MSSKNFIVILNIWSKSKSKKIKIIFFFELFFRSSCFFCYFLFVSFSAAFLARFKIDWKIKSIVLFKKKFFQFICFFDSLFFCFSFFLTDQIVFLTHHLKKAQKIEFKSKIFKSISKILIEIITMLYSKSIDFASKLVSSSRKIKKKINQIEIDISFSKQWIVDEFLIIKAINQLFKSTYAFQNSLAFKTITDLNNISFVEKISKFSLTRTLFENSFKFFSKFFSIIDFSLKTSSATASSVLSEKKLPRKKIESNAIITSTNTLEVLAVIKNVQKNSKEFVSTFKFLIKIESILSEIFSKLKFFFVHFFLSLFKKNSNKKSSFILETFKASFIFETSKIVFSITFSKTDLSQSFELTKITSFQSVYSSTISRISVLKKNLEIRFVISSMNFFDSFNTIVFLFSILSISV